MGLGRALPVLLVWSCVAQGAEAPSPEGGKPGAKAEPDFLDRLKTVKAGDIVFRFAAEERIRFERWNNEDLDDHKDDRDRRLFARTRLKMDTVFSDWLQTRVELVDGREWMSERDPRSQNDDLDLHQAYVELGGKPVMVRLGRQEIDLGSRRLVAAPTWNNILRSFDAVRATYTSDAVEVHAFCGSVVVGEDDHFNEHRHDERFSGLYATLKPVPDHKLDLYVFRLHTWNPGYYVTGEDKVKGEHKRYTYGARLHGNLAKRWTYEVEGAVQRGHYANDPIRAWAFYGTTTYTFDLPWQPAIQPVLVCASGDKDPTDGRHGTFDPLYASTHDMFGGIMDRVTWMNVRSAGVRLRAKPTAKLTVGVEAHRYWLAEEKDAWYTTGKKAARRDKAGKSGDDIGCEIGCCAKYAVNKRLEVEGGVARFFPGAFADRTGPSDTAEFCYLMTVLKF
ncbi:MAG TPA: alginate export family protein [Planctomycetota bacterium]|nr:alginate export family protein [Planctomycetota bacterium]HRT93469.1 alginate export family protein [Planctomycetota bacterium]